MKKFLLNSKALVITMVVATLFLTNAAQAQKTWDGGAGTNNWGDANNWNPNGVPASTDAVMLINNTTVNVNVAAVAASVTFPSTNANAITLNINTGFSLTVGGTITIPRGNNGVNTLAVGAGTLTAGSIAFTNTGTAVRHILSISTGTATISGDIVVELVGAGDASPTINLTSTGTLKIGGTLFLNTGGDLNPGTTSTVEFNGSAAQTINVTNYTYANVTTNNSAATGAVFGAAVTATNITGNINVASGLLRTNNLAVAIATGKTLTVAANATFNAGTTSLKFNGGTATINGTFQTANTTAFSGVAGAAISSTNAPTIALNAGSTIEYNAAGTQPVTARTDYKNLTLTGGSKTITGTVTLAGDLTINNGATYNGAANPALTVNGDFTNAGTFTQGTAVVTLSGAAAQVITPTAATTFAGLTINNTAGGVSLAGNATVSGTLTLTSGILSINAGSTLLISNGNAIAVTTPGTTKHIATLVSGASQGFVRVNNMAAAAYTFPVGTGTNYLPVTVTPTNATVASNSYTVNVFTGITVDGLPNGAQQQNKTNVVDAVWTVNYNGPGTPIATATTLGMNWPAALEGSNFATLTGTGAQQLGISHSAGGVWGDYQNATSANNTTNIATLAGITSFSPFSVGKAGTANAVLPIKIAYFNASKGTNANTINWSAETNSAQVSFEIERSADGVNFNTINTVTADRARAALPFSIVDASPLPGTNFYRIKMIDIDGRITYTSIVKVGNAPRDIQLVGVLPNPVVNTAQLSITTTKKDNIEVAVISLDGRVMSKQSVQLQSGSSLVSLDVSKLSRGTYFVKGTFSDGTSNAVKFVKE